MSATDVVVIGAGQAGFSVCSRLRSLGFSGRVTLIGGEPHPPYQRPPLSKAYLLGDMDQSRLHFRPETYYAEANIKLITGCKVSRIDRDASGLELDDGRRLRYDRLVLTVGALPIKLPVAIGGALEGVFSMRDLADADRLAENFKPGQRALIVGGGYIGLEAAAVAIKCGVTTVLVEAADRILQRVASKEISRHLRALHLTKGVDLREGLMLSNLIGENGRVTGGEFSDGSVVPVDLVVVGIGARPNHTLAEAAGLTIENGISVNQCCETSDPKILAAGDCASFPHLGGMLRLESVGNAIDMGETVAQVIMGNRQPYLPNPWFWSDQYNTKLQIVGLYKGCDSTVARITDENTVSFWHYAGDRLLSVEAINDPRSYMVGKRLIETDKTVPKSEVADPAVNLKLFLEKGRSCRT